MSVAELNRDGRPDIVVAYRGTSQPASSEVCLNQGDRRFTCQPLATGSVAKILPVDLDRDGDVDLVVPHLDIGQSAVFFNDGRGRFGRNAPFGPAGAEARAAAAGDVNGDGWPDVIVGDIRMGVSLYLNDGHGALVAAGQRTERVSGRVLLVERTPCAIAIGDLNNDRRPDIVLGFNGGSGSVLFNDGTGRRFVEVSFGNAEGSIYEIALGDLDGDGGTDIATARSNSPSAISEALEPRLPLPPGRPRTTGSALLGVWHGDLKQGDGDVFNLWYLRVGEPYQVELVIDQVNQVGAIAGRTIYHTPGLVLRCSKTNMLRGALDSGRYLLRERAEYCGFGDGYFVAIGVVDENHLRLEYLADDQRTVKLAVVLTRKAVGSQ